MIGEILNRAEFREFDDDCVSPRRYGDARLITRHLLVTVSTVVDSRQCSSAPIVNRPRQLLPPTA